MNNTTEINSLGIENSPLINDLLININDSATTKDGLSIHTKRINQSMVLMTLYGADIEVFLTQLLKIRAIDQKGTADQITKNIFHALFKPETDPQFNTFIQQSQEAYFDKIITLCQSEKDRNKIRAKMEKNLTEFFHFEIDGTVLLNYLPPFNQEPNRNTTKSIISKDKSTRDKNTTKKNTKEKNQITQRSYIEIKMFTMPEGDETKSIRPRLQKSFLTRNFTINNYLGLMGFSYLHKKGENSPLAIDFKTGRYPEGIQSVWAVHLVILDRTILRTGLKAPTIANLILKAMQEHDHKLLQQIESQLDLNFRPTNNLVKVILMAQIIHQLKQQVEYERKQKEEERKQKEEALVQKEEALVQKEKYEELLKKHNISFE
jgi:hypothetical protein